MSRKTHGGCLLGCAALAALLLPYKKEETENGSKWTAYLYDSEYRKDEDEYDIDLFNRPIEQLRLAKKTISAWLSDSGKD